MGQRLQLEDAIGGYRIERLLGEGGMGSVYLATHVLLGRKAAIKVLLPQLCHNQEVVKRFFNEAKATTAIEHAGIVQVFDFGHHDDGSAFIVMELLQGESLEARLQKAGRLPINEALRIIRQVASALAAAHGCGVIHRDLKPDNIFLVPDPELEGGERIKILDFGIAKLASGDSGDSGPEIKTRIGSVLGTPWYMAPEQCSGAGEIDHRADVYSLGCVLFHLLCGRPPFLGAGTGDILAAHLREPTPSPRSFEATIPVELEAVIVRALAKRPDQRFATMDELAANLAGVYRARITGVGGITGPHSGLHVLGDTTLSGSAAQVNPGVAPVSRRRRVQVLMGAGLATALVSAMAIITIAKYAQDDRREPAVSAPIVVAPEPVASTPSVPADARAPVKPPAPEVTIAITSNPPGATVVRVADGAILGTTPYATTVPAQAGQLVFVLEKAGFADRLVSFPGNQGGVREFALVATTPKQRRRAKPSHGRRQKSLAKDKSPATPKPPAQEDGLEYR